MTPAGGEPELLRHGTDAKPALLWTFDAPRRMISSAPLGGGIGARHWIVNAQVDKAYGRVDIDGHLAEIAAGFGCRGDGVGMLTAAWVERFGRGADDEVAVFATVGVSMPTWASDVDGAVSELTPGTINIVAFVPTPLTDAALVNAVMTVTEAKSQALLDFGVPGTGTASDAVCVVCGSSGEAERFAGPRSRAGAPLARATFAAVTDGLRGGDA